MLKPNQTPVITAKTLTSLCYAVINVILQKGMLSPQLTPHLRELACSNPNQALNELISHLRTYHINFNQKYTTQERKN